MKYVGLAALACGCRFGFDGAGMRDASPSPDARLDARPDAPANAITYVFGERPSATYTRVTSDSYISRDMEGGTDDRPHNFGGEDRMKIKQGEDHGLLRFDVSAIASSATVFAADLEVVVSTGAPGSIVALHAVREAWLENNLQGTPGTCNWTMRDPANAWTAPGAAPPGSAGQALVSFSTASAGAVVVALPSSTVQGWIADPSSNHGLLLLETTGLDNPDLATRETSPAASPTLTVTVVP